MQDLIHQGDKLVPEGGLEFSGYNAKMQSQYLLWRKNCLDALSKCGEKGTALRSQLTNDENGAYFYQTSAQRVHDALERGVEICRGHAAPQQQPPAVAKPRHRT